jgi:signal transduction histidine kinase
VHLLGRTWLIGRRADGAVVSSEAIAGELGRGAALAALGAQLEAEAETVTGLSREVSSSEGRSLDGKIERVFEDTALLATIAVARWMEGGREGAATSLVGGAAERFARYACRRSAPQNVITHRWMSWRDATRRVAAGLACPAAGLEAEVATMVGRCFDVALLRLCDAYEDERLLVHEELIVRQAKLAEQAELAEHRLRELHLAQADLVQAQKLESIGQLAAGIAHEINTPMQFIGDNASFLRSVVERLLAVAEAADAVLAADATEADRTALAELLARSRIPMLRQRAPKAADDTLSGVESITHIVTAMKRFSHPGSGSTELVDVNESLATTITVCRNEWKYAAEVTTDLAPDLPLIEGHRGALNQVWINLIVNASHAVADRHDPAKGTIAIATAAAGGGGVTITFSDDGSGIPAEHLEKIFDPFFTTKSVGRGTGQGLSIAYRVITTEHHGTLTVRSVVGEGTTFTITLPQTSPASAR